jgi:hypothetical protein
MRDLRRRGPEAEKVLETEEEIMTHDSAQAKAARELEIEVVLPGR